MWELSENILQSEVHSTAANVKLEQVFYFNKKSAPGFWKAPFWSSDTGWTLQHSRSLCRTTLHSRDLSSAQPVKNLKMTSSPSPLSIKPIENWEPFKDMIFIVSEFVEKHHFKQHLKWGCCFKKNWLRTDTDRLQEWKVHVNLAMLFKEYFF